eukprot:jgi/Psemu1/288859/fgenesh1_pg.294_\
MRVGIIGNGIVGTAIAATLAKHRPSVEVTLIDDGRPHKTSEAGQGYLFSVHRPHLPGLEYLPDAAERNTLLRPGTFRGLFSPGDCTCNPPQLIDWLQRRFGLSTNTDHRTVTDLRAELRVGGRDGDGGGAREDSSSGFDCVICCAGPWINELEDVGVEPVRGLLLEATATVGGGISASSFPGSDPVPVMEYGYGTEGIHFTLSSRGDALLIGASREGVGFSTDELDDLEEAILNHARRFVVEGGIGPVAKRRLGFRPACTDHDHGTVNTERNRNRNYRIERSAMDKRIILVYGFED